MLLKSKQIIRLQLQFECFKDIYPHVLLEMLILDRHVRSWSRDNIDSVKSDHALILFSQSYLSWQLSQGSLCYHCWRRTRQRGHIHCRPRLFPPPRLYFLLLFLSTHESLLVFLCIQAYIMCLLVPGSATRFLFFSFVTLSSVITPASSCLCARTESRCDNTSDCDLLASQRESAGQSW